MPDAGGDRGKTDCWPAQRVGERQRGVPARAGGRQRSQCRAKSFAFGVMLP
jgi:hypothetical protein